MGPSAASKPEPRHSIASSPSTAQRVGTAKVTFCSHAGKMKAGTQLPPSMTSSRVARMAMPRVASGVLPNTAISRPNVAVMMAKATHTPRKPARLPSIFTPNTTRANPNTVSMIAMATIPADAARLPMMT